MIGDWNVIDVSPESSPRSVIIGDELDEHEPEEKQEQESGKLSLNHQADGVCIEQNGVYHDASAKLLSGSWPIEPFDENLPTNKRKAEWFRFRDQFERIASCKSHVDQKLKLTGLKIYAGRYLLSIIEMHEKSIPILQLNIYDQIIDGLNNYFNKSCDNSKERIKFREMRMRNEEPFEDWILRLETQAKFCEFSSEQRHEEFLQAVLRRSVPEISSKLYEMSEIFERNIERIINHGQHLDYIRRELCDSKQGDKENSMDYESKPVNAVQQHYGQRSRSYEGRRGMTNNFRGRNRSMQSGHTSRQLKCTRCGRFHEPKQCKAWGLKCHNCKKLGHYAEFCRSTESRYPREVGDSKDNLKKEVAKINQVRSDSDSD